MFFHRYDVFYTHINIYRYFTIVLSNLHFVSSDLHLHLHEICFVKVFHSFIAVIMLKKFRFKSSVLFRTHTLLDKPLIVLQFSAHPSNLTENV